MWCQHASLLLWLWLWPWLWLYVCVVWHSLVLHLPVSVCAACGGRALGRQSEASNGAARRVARCVWPGRHAHTAGDVRHMVCVTRRHCNPHGLHRTHDACGCGGRTGGSPSCVLAHRLRPRVCCVDTATAVAPVPVAFPVESPGLAPLTPGWHASGTMRQRLVGP